MQTKYLRTNVTTHIANILHSRLAASANSLRRPFTELQYLRRNVILRLTINNFPGGNKLYRTQIMTAAAASINFTGIAFHGIFFHRQETFVTPLVSAITRWWPCSGRRKLKFHEGSLSRLTDSF